MDWKDPVILGAMAGSGKFEVQWLDEIYAGSLCKCELDYELLDKWGIGNKTLIARPISDMSDEELSGLPSFQGLGFTPKSIKHHINMRVYEWLFEDALYLLKKGILPKEFEHQFESGEVITRYENGGNDE